MPKRKRNDGTPKTVCQHRNTEVRLDGNRIPIVYCFDCKQFTKPVYD